MNVDHTLRLLTRYYVQRSYATPHVRLNNIIQIIFIMGVHVFLYMPFIHRKLEHCVQRRVEYIF
jgi:hypothetical protein